ncbi:hypothetical protein EON63_03555 [archaeon]|nr:MAG: hypothetical protein EON63_03555 [archaeon]
MMYKNDVVHAHSNAFYSLRTMRLECQCALPDGLKGCKNLPAEMKVDYIRLYQDVTDSSHSLGCSTKSFPSSQFIAAHAGKGFSYAYYV